MGEYSCKCLKYNPKDHQEANLENNNNYINTYSYRNEKTINNTLDMSNSYSDTNDRTFFNGIQKIGEITKNPFYEIINPSILNLKNSLPPLKLNSKINLINFSSNNKKFLKSSIKLFNEDLFYQGEWSKNYKMNGQGLMYIIQREILFEGLFQNNTFIYGRIYYPDLTYYEGDVINSRKNGYGKIVFNDGCIFQGNFKDDLFDGEGEINWNNGSYYKGGFSYGKFNGKGKLKFGNGNSYEGDFKNNNFEGNGIFKWKDNKKYIGKYHNNKKNGKGIFYSDKENVIIEGNWVNGNINGNSKIEYFNKIYHTEWIDGNLMKILKVATNGKLINMEDEDLTKIPQISFEKEDFFPENFSHLSGKF